MPRLVLVAAPAGFGKTTLLTQWVAGLNESPHARPLVAWVSVESGDRDVKRFLSGLVSAVRQASGGAAGAETQALLEGDRPAPVGDVLASLVNELDELADPVILALDDFHLADSADVHEAVGFLLDHLPPRVTVAMTSRSDPPLSLARLRTRGELVEVRAADLRFTPDEAGRFLTEVMGLELDPDQVAALEARTEGWAAGLQLAALSARGRATEAPGAVDAFISDFTGSHRFVLDYLLEEVLNAEDEHVRAFLLRTAVLDQMTGSLCDALTGDDSGQQTLKQLESRNLFVIPLDDTRGWYRYHHLFADALRARLLVQSPEQIADLHRAASGWYAEQGMLADAVRHAFDVTDDQLTADLVEAALPDLRKHRQDQTIIDWLDTLPDDVVRIRPLLATFRAWTHMAKGELGNVEDWLSAAEQAFSDEPSALQIRVPAEVEGRRIEEYRIVPATIAIYRASLAQAHGDVAATIEHASRSRELAGPDDHLVHAAAAGFLGLADWVAGDLLAARAKFEETCTRLEAAGNAADALATTVPVAGMTLALGEPNRARLLFEQAIATAEAHTGPVLAGHADLHVGLADLLREQGELETAAEHLETARELGDRASLPENRFRWYSVSANLLRATGDLDGALAMLERAQQLYLPGFFPDVQPLGATRARVLISQGRFAEAHAWATERELSCSDEPAYRTEYEHLTFARLLIAGGGDQAASSLELLDKLVEAAGTADRTGSRIEAVAVRALAKRALGDINSAVEDMSVALTVGVPAGYRRLFLDEGAPMQDLLRATLARTDAVAHSAAEELLGQPSRPQPATVPRPAGAEALSERELEVLRLLTSDLTGPEIAQHLFISLNTLRTHTKRIFTKLDVKTRRAAVTRATELGLL
jgi:LuxR family maltose regulon positive regulatory protein